MPPPLQCNQNRAECVDRQSLRRVCDHKRRKRNHSFINVFPFIIATRQFRRKTRQE
tara:strand:+ start:964 stop:1131 length:168 start_codon:yes stop_codon:yes gene_type:complete